MRLGDRVKDAYFRLFHFVHLQAATADEARERHNSHARELGHPH
jgi:hypothetical protein